MGGGEGLFESCLIFLWDFHRVECHVHVVFCHECDAALGGELGLKTVAVVEVTVVVDGDVFVGFDALVDLGFGFLRHIHLVHEVPAVGPELAAQDVLVEEIRRLGELDGHVDVAQAVVELAEFFLE